MVRWSDEMLEDNGERLSDGQMVRWSDEMLEDNGERLDCIIRYDIRS